MWFHEFEPVDEPHLIYSIPYWKRYTRHLWVGWIGKEPDYPTGEVSPEVVDRLWEACRDPTERIKGFHYCLQCNRPGFIPVAYHGMHAEVGDGYVAVESGADMLIAPDLIIHYVLDHGYVPPQAFQNAITSNRRIPPLDVKLTRDTFQEVMLDLHCREVIGSPEQMQKAQRVVRERANARKLSFAISSTVSFCRNAVLRIFAGKNKPSDTNADRP